MATGACGINCDVCQLHVRGICSSCGSGTSDCGKAKARVQEKLFGSPCPILACARMNRIDYCIRDCKTFPCENFETSEYPFGKQFLNMQKRRRTPANTSKEKYGFDIEVPDQHWEALQEKNFKNLCSQSGAILESPYILNLQFLLHQFQVDKKKNRIFKKIGHGFEEVTDPLLELLILVYLLNACEQTIENRMVSVKDLKSWHFFHGPHTVRTEKLVEKFGFEKDKFLRAGRALGGIPIQKADASFCIMAFPKVPIYYMLWTGDEDFPAEVSILFDKSIESHLPPDGIWGLTILVTDALLHA